AAKPFMRVLIDCGADLNASNSLGDTPIYQACLEGHVTAAELLIRSGAYLNLPKRVRHHPADDRLLHRRRGPSSSCCCATELAWIVATWPARRPLTTAARPRPGLPAPAARRARGGRLRPDGSDGTSPLMEAAYQGASDQLLDLLLSAAPESALAARDCRDRGALFYAIEGGSLPTFQRLLRAASGVTLLMTAALRYRRRLAELLVDLLRNEADRRNALFYCVANPEPDLLQLLLDSGLPAEKQRTPHCSWPASPAATGLWWTSCCARADSLAPLVDLAAVDSAGESALTLANQQLLHQLIGMGGAAVTDGENFPKRWRRLLQLACQCGNAEAAMLFAEMAKPDDLTVAVRGGDADGEGEGEGEGDDGLLFFCVRGGHVDLTRHFLRLLRGTATGRHWLTARPRLVARIYSTRPAPQAAWRWSRCSSRSSLILLKDAQGRNAYFYAVQSGSRDLLDLLDGTPGLEPTPDNRAGGSGGQAAVLQQLRSNLGHYGLTESAVDSDGRGAAFYAAESDSWPLVEDLLTRAGTSEEPATRRAGLCSCTAPPAAPPQWRSSWMPTAENALFYAVRARNSELAAALLRGGLAPAPNSRGQSILALAYATGQGRLAELLLTTPGLQTADLLNGCDDQRCTGFQHLVIEQRVDHLARLAGLFEPARDSDEREESALIKAARQANPRMLKLLLEAFNGLDVGSPGWQLQVLQAAAGLRSAADAAAAKDGSTLLHLGARSGNVQVFMHLLRFFVPSGIQQEAGCDAECQRRQRDFGGAHPVRAGPLGLRRGVSPSRRLLCGGGGGSSESSEDLRDKKGRSPAMLAALSNNLAPCPNPLVLRQLLDRRADPQAADADGSARCTWPYRARAPSRPSACCWTGALTPSSRLAPGQRVRNVRQNPRRRGAGGREAGGLLLHLLRERP
uniref:ANK_REP_REGION domain-containing protein n=1 Tax=Macrostomum lignano TaxID=282301 RepID=A0A1I8FIP3_9PLAT